jgi:N-acetylmuramoyl-L-alanine amidase CwlA
MAKRTNKTTGKDTAPKPAASKKKSTAKKAVAKKKAVVKKKATVKKKAAVKKKAIAKPRSPKKTTAKAGIRRISADERRHMIAEAAYLRAESQGFVSDHLHDWLAAEVAVDRALEQAKIKVTG